MKVNATSILPNLSWSVHYSDQDIQFDSLDTAIAYINGLVGNKPYSEHFDLNTHTITILPDVSNSDFAQLN